MSRSLKLTLAGVALTLASIAAAPAPAKAEEFCREYTRTVYIGGRTQEAYGQACLQPDGSWMIVGEGLGNDIPQEANNVTYVVHDNYREIQPQRVVYYERSPRYYRSRPAPVFVWNHNNGYYRHGQFVNYRPYHRPENRWDRHDRHGRDDHRGRERGHGRD